MAEQRTLTVFDLGMHNGDDTAFYLERGFRVIAVEANPDLCEQNGTRFEEMIARGSLVILNKAIYCKGGKNVNFYISAMNLEWSSLAEHREEPGPHGSKRKKISVETITLRELYGMFGVPHYIKCDIEGAENIFCRQLLQEDAKPDFVSVELARNLRPAAFLLCCGYDSFQLVNQAKVRRFASRKSFDGSPYGTQPATITGHCSGEFGLDLDSEKWLSFDEAAYRFLKHVDLKRRDPDMTLDNWFDIHAMRSNNADTPSTVTEYRTV